MRRMDAGTSEFRHPRTKEIEPGEVEFLLGVIAADALGGIGREDAIGADHLAAGHLAHQQVVAVRVVEIGIESWMERGQARAHFLGEHLVAQALRFADFAVVDRQRDVVAAGRGRVKIAAGFEHGALPGMECAQLSDRVLRPGDVGIAKR